jgi:hexosaminidase
MHSSHAFARFVSVPAQTLLFLFKIIMFMKYTIKQNLATCFLLFIFLTASAFAAADEPAAHPGQLIPLPVSVQYTGGIFHFSKKTAIYYQQNHPELKKSALFLARLMRPSTGYRLPLVATNKKPAKGSVYLTLIDRQDLGNEGYLLTITRKGILLSAYRPAGIFRGIQTLRQLLPAQIENKKRQNLSWRVPTVTITDFPAYAYRGAMLDVSRHFFGVKTVKKLIDLMALYKLNVLHLHLSDDQGWRIAIKSWPDLAKIGGSSEVGGGKGGYYTQQQFKELVQYAADRYITIVPEIDMPGHIHAALASYANLNCDNRRKKLFTGIKVGFSTLCVHKEITYRFLDDVIGEIAALSPGPWFHIGGDESHATPKKDYLPFIEKVQKIVHAHGKKVIGWDEIAQTPLQPGTMVQYWAHKKYALEAVRQGAKIILSPGDRTYLDMKYDSATTLGLHWAGYVNVKKAYDWNPATLIPGVPKTAIAGIEAPLWSETITSLKDIEYMVFPRLIGDAEIGWTPDKLRSWDNYRARLGAQALRLDLLHVNFYRSKLIPWHDK